MKGLHAEGVISGQIIGSKLIPALEHVRVGKLHAGKADNGFAIAPGQACVKTAPAQPNQKLARPHKHADKNGA